jgi:hypothetical protein
MQTVQQIQAHGLDQPHLFAALSDRFPGRSNLIEAAERTYLGDSSTDADQTDDLRPVADLGSAPQAAVRTAFEKIMGDRPTFLDVSYLAVGYQRAKSVAKLRMKFAKGWAAGTAFLVTPDTLLTARHNLWSDNTCAQEVEVIFDYERSGDGPDMEGTLQHPDLGSLAGDANDDWAVLKLRDAQSARPLAPLADKPAIKGDRVAIIQHPSGMLKQVALHHNLVTYADDMRLQYLTDTMPGSSGSPVFDGEWKVVAIHHMGGELALPGTKQTVYRNQGVPIRRVVAGAAALGMKL